MIKHLIFDFGGVFLNLHGRTSGVPANLAAIFNLPVAEVEALWQENKTKLITGQETPRDFLVFLCQQFELKHNLDDALEKWAAKHTVTQDKIDWELVAYAEELKHHYRLHLLTDQINIGEDDKLKSKVETLFTQIFRSYEQGVRKPDLSAFHNVLAQIKAQPQDCVFIDDDVKNIEAARSIGMYAIQYHFGHVTELKTELQKLI